MTYAILWALLVIIGVLAVGLCRASGRPSETPCRVLVDGAWVNAKIVGSFGDDLTVERDDTHERICACRHDVRPRW